MSKMKEKFAKLDIITLLLMFILIGAGLYCIYQVSSNNPLKEDLFDKQVLGVLIGFFFLTIMLFIDYQIICRLSLLIYIGIVGILAYLLVFGEAINNVKRWITIAGIQFQPSELAKLAMILFLSSLCARYKNKINDFNLLLLMGIVTAVPFLLIVKEPHLSSALSILFILCLLIYASEISYKALMKAVAIIFPIVAILIVSVLVFDVNIPFVQSYQIKRILTFRSDDEAENAAGKYQQLQSISAIQSGGLEGKTLSADNNSRGYQYIYANESDFVFSVVGEEFGFIISMVIILCYLALILRCLRLATLAADYLGKLLCMGVSAFLTFQVFINIGVATSLLPNTGLSLPFISYGLSSLINSILAVGVVLNVGMRRTVNDYK